MKNAVARVATSIAFVLTPAGFGPLAEAAAPVKVGFADPTKALGDTADGKKARAALEKELDSKKKLLEAKEGEVKKAAELLEKKRALLAADALAKEEATLRKMYGELSTLASSLRLELDTRERELTTPLYARFECILRKMGELDGYTLILPVDGILWAAGHLDLTSEITRKYEAGVCKDVKPTAPAKAPAPGLKLPAPLGSAKPATGAPASAKPASATPK